MYLHLQNEMIFMFHRIKECGYYFPAYTARFVENPRSSVPLRPAQTQVIGISKMVFLCILEN